LASSFKGGDGVYPVFFVCFTPLKMLDRRGGGGERRGGGVFDDA